MSQRTWYYGLPAKTLADEKVVLILNLDRHLTWRQKHQWNGFYGEIYTGEARFVALHDAHCRSKIRLLQDRTYYRESWRPIAVWALCPPGMKEEKRMLVPLAFEKWKVVFQLADVCWQETSYD